MDPIFYTVQRVNGDYADLLSDGGREHSITMFLLPEGTTVGSPVEVGGLSVGADLKNPCAFWTQGFFY